MIKLRPYQAKSISALRNKYASGINKILLVAPTGSGKTLVVAEILKKIRENGVPALFVVRGRSLVSQASERLTSYGIPHAVIMANHRAGSTDELIKVCSIDTLHARGTLPAADFICVDEAHMTTGDAYETLIRNYPQARFLSVTATPFLRQGMRHIADDYVSLVTMQELIDQGYLAPFRYFAPSVIDTQGVAKANGDFVTSQLFGAVDKKKIYGDIVESYCKFLDGKTALAYGVNVAHAKKIQDSFINEGIPCGFVDAKTTLAERSALIRALISREMKVISSVGTMTTGIDIPCLDGLIIARPTESLNLHLQILGRVTRTSPGKTHGVVIDHAGNLMRHGFAEQARDIDLDGIPARKKEPALTTCKLCFAVYITVLCPSCGTKRIVEANERTGPVHVEASFGEISALRRRYIELEILRKKTKTKKGRAYHPNTTIYKLMTEYPLQEIMKELPSEYWRFKKSKSFGSARGAD